VPGAGTGKPHLRISHGDVMAQFCPQDADPVTGEDARIARELADKAAGYAAEIERMHVASPAYQSGEGVMRRRSAQARCVSSSAAAEIARSVWSRTVECRRRRRCG
jgi:hypothetical protein